ncbi:MAG: hypothetical protein ACRC4W_06720 [Treponemataceae bacterium]
MMASIKNIFFGFLLLSLSSCSLNYGQREFSEEGVPELIFYDTEYMKFERSRKTTSVKASVLEFYGKESLVFGKEVEFKLYNTDQSPSAEGKTGLLYADQDAEIYTLLDESSISSYNQNMTVNAESLRWNNLTEQLVAGEEDEVTIEYGSLKDDGDAHLKVKGKKFSASGIGLEYRFGMTPTGTILTGSDKATVEVEQEDDFEEPTSEIVSQMLGPLPNSDIIMGPQNLVDTQESADNIEYDNSMDDLPILEEDDF